MLMLIFLIYFFFLYPATLLFLCDNMLIFLLYLLPFGLARLQLSFLVTYWIQLSLLSIIFCLSFHLTYLHILNIVIENYEELCREEEIAGNDAFVLMYCGEYYDTIPCTAMDTYFDTKYHAIGFGEDL